MLKRWLLMVCLLASTGYAAELTDKVNWPEFLARHDLAWKKLPSKWSEGAFIGNGLLGTMIYREADTLRWDIGRSDVADHRQTGNDACYDKARLPIGHFLLKPVGTISGGTMRVDLWNAEATGKLTTDRGTIEWRSFAHANDLVMAMEFKASAGERDFQWIWVAEASTSTRRLPPDYKPNPPSQLKTEGDVNVCFQPMTAGGHYATAWQKTESAVYISIGTSDEAVAAVRKAVQSGVEKLAVTHRDWWHAFWPKGFLSLPDTRMESFYWIQIYKLASATRADRPAIDLMGPWFHATKWPAIWWNLNIQLAYSPVYTANRLELGESLCGMLDRNLTNLIQNVSPEFQHDSAAISRVTGNDCVGMVGNEVGNLTWACHNYWRQCRYGGDDVRMREKLLPLLRRAVNYYRHLLTKGDDGKLHLPETSSPEYGVQPDSNYDLALLRWGCQTLIAECERLKIADPLLPEWKRILATLTDYPTGPDGLMIGRDKPLAKSHRHYSHLLMIYPLYTMNWDQPEHRDLIAKSLDHWIGFEGALKGYSFTGSSSICASIGRRDQAVQLLNAFIERYPTSNTMYLEGSPVIETPLSAAQCVHDLLLQSWGGTIRIFPGVPDSWKDVAFHNLRAEGAFLVSAVRKGGKTQFVRIKSLAGEPCRVLVDGELKELKLAKGEETILGSGDPVIAPVAAQAGRCNLYGGK